MRDVTTKSKAKNNPTSPAAVPAPNIAKVAEPKDIYPKIQLMWHLSTGEEFSSDWEVASTPEGIKYVPSGGAYRTFCGVALTEENFEAALAARVRENQSVERREAVAALTARVRENALHRRGKL
jgi:hypothetical protein